MRGIVPLIIISIFLSIAYYLYNSSLEYDQYSIILEEYNPELYQELSGDSNGDNILDILDIISIINNILGS